MATCVLQAISRIWYARMHCTQLKYQLTTLTALRWRVNQNLRRLADEDDELSEVQPDAVPPEVREWLASTFTRQLATTRRKADEKPKFRSVAHAIRAGIFVDRIYRRVTSTSLMQFPPDVVKVLKTLDEWSFDVFALSETATNMPVKYLGYDLLNRYGMIHKFKVPPSTLEAFLTRIEEGYCRYRNPYHNNLHAADVAQTVHYMLCQTGLMNWLTDLEIFATLVAALIHDYEHTGTTNNFHVMSGTETALLYNDRAVLENHHISAAFRVMRDEECNILQNLSREEFREFRTLVIDMVLATDMSFHFQQLKNMRNLLTLPEVSVDKSKALSLVLHCCDISHPAKRWDLHHRWTSQLLEEFFRQGDKERELGLPFSPLCDRNNTLVAESQIGFIEFIVEPSMAVCSDMLEAILGPLHSSCKPTSAESIQSTGSENSDIDRTKNGSTQSPERGQKYTIKKPWVGCLAENKRIWKEQAAKEFWAEFFQAAGLEPVVAASYANIFFVNKIQLNHLPDIDRDALREMNITPMGDILTILKYIKLYCASVTSPVTTSRNEQMLLHQDNALKCNAQLRNLQDSKSGFCGQNQFECGAQHSIAQAENSFLSHYLHSTDILDGSDIPPPTVHESPLNLTVHGKFCTIQKSNEHGNSVNSTVSCDTSEATSHMYSISPNKLEMAKGTNGLNNLERNMNISYVNSCGQQSVVKEKIINPGRGTPQQKRSVFDRLGQRSDAEKIWVKTSFKQFSHSRHFKLCRQKCTPQRDNGVMRSNHLRKKWHCSPIADDKVNNNIGSINTITMDSEPFSALHVKSYNEDTNKEAVSASRLNIQEVRSESSPGNSNKQLEVVCNENLTDAGTSGSDRNNNQENSFHELHSVEDISQSLTSRISLPASQDGKTTRSASENGKLSQETVTIDTDAVVITPTPPCISSSQQNEDPELESLRDPTLTHHSEQFYLAWADRRKQAQLFPGFKPSFLQES